MTDCPWSRDLSVKVAVTVVRYVTDAIATMDTFGRDLGQNFSLL